MGTAIVVTSGKGGTGKTSITGGVAGSLARLGHSVLCIDMDIGLRNLDISLGLSDRALMDFSDVAEGRCPLVRAAVNHPDLPGLALLTAPMTLSPALTEEAVRRMLDTARSLYDYVLIDSPAGLGAGFRMACCGADRAIVVSTNDASSLRDAQRTVGELDFLRQIHLVMNRIQPKLLVNPLIKARKAGLDYRLIGHRRPATAGRSAGGPPGDAVRQPGAAPDPGRTAGGGQRLPEHCQASGGAPGPYHADPLNSLPASV